MSFKDALKKTFYNVPEEQTKEQVEVVEETEATVAEDVQEDAPAPAVNADILEALKHVIDEVDNAHPDEYTYYKFMHTVSEQDNPSEKKKYEVVFSILKNMGITAESLILSADNYIHAIQNHYTGFDSKIALEEQEKVVKLNSEAEAIETTITSKSEQIEALKVEIKALHEKKVSIVDIARANDVSITKLKQEGTMAYKVVISQIEDGKNKITKYIS